MSARISASVGSYESGAINRREDVKVVQRLLTEVSKKLRSPLFDPKGIDGLISRTASRSSTVTAITNFQLKQVMMRNADQRIDVNGKTWGKLVQVAGPAATRPAPPARPAAGLVTLTVSHGGKIPTKTKFNDGTKSNAGMYESRFVLSGGLSGTFSGSIYPDDMTVKGRVVDGTYTLHIGFHKGGSAPRQGADKLVVATQKIRPGLLVNARNGVPVDSNNPSKTTSYGINVHNGFNNSRGSDGCLTLLPADWPKFIQKFLDGYPDIKDWHTVGTNTGKKIGNLIIKS